MGDVWDAPNQQVVRADQSAPWDEGSGGGEGPPSGLEAMTKDELLGLARSLGVTPANSATSKADLIAGIEAAQEQTPTDSGAEESG